MNPSVQVLINLEETLEHILSYLPAIELLRKSAVCRSWQRTAKRILQKRSRSFALDYKTFTYEGFCADHTESSCGSSSRRTRKRLKLNDKAHCQLCKFKSTVLSWQSQWHQTPKIIMLVCKSNEASAKNFLKASKAIFDELQKQLPKDCIIFMFRSSMCCRFNSKISFVIKAEALLFSSTSSNCINVLTWTSIKTDASKSKLLNAIKNFSVCQEDLKVLMFFYDISNNSIVSWIRKTLIPFLKNDLKLSEEVVILGCAIFDYPGIVHSKSCSNSMISLTGNKISAKKSQKYDSSDRGQFLVMALNGNSIFSASLLADYNVKSITDLSAKLKVLKKSFQSMSLSSKSSFGFVISCIDRMHDSVWYNDFDQSLNNHVETTALQEEFPELPILTMHGFGEIGCNANLLGLVDEEESMIHSRAAIFAVVHCGEENCFNANTV